MIKIKEVCKYIYQIGRDMEGAFDFGDGEEEDVHIEHEDGNI